MMNPSVNEMVNWLGSIDAKASEMLDLAASAGAEPVQIMALKQCVTCSVIFLAQLLRSLEDERELPDAPARNTTVDDYDAYAISMINRHFRSSTRRN